MKVINNIKCPYCNYNPITLKMLEGHIKGIKLGPYSHTLCKSEHLVTLNNKERIEFWDSIDKSNFTLMFPLILLVFI